jgi:hypothetical protein
MTGTAQCREAISDRSVGVCDAYHETGTHPGKLFHDERSGGQSAQLISSRALARLAAAPHVALAF